MLDPIIMFFEGMFLRIGRAFGIFISWLAWPFVAITRWFRGRHWVIKGPIALVLIGLALLYGYFIVQAESWTNFNAAYPDKYEFSKRTASAGEQLTGDASGRKCENSGIVAVTADLIDFNVNQNAWISSMIAYKMGLFGLDWDDTPFLDNKASFQRGINQALRRTAVELVDTLGRVRGTSAVNSDLQNARGNLQFDEYTWYFGLSPFGPKTPSPSFYRSAMKDLRKFNSSLENCDAVFDGRADNLMSFLDRIANDLGSTSDILRERSENYSSGWFDTRADDRFWFAYGQLYAYYGILEAARSDFSNVVRERNVGSLWDRLDKQFQSALRIQPAIISNGSEDGWIMPTHLATMGFYILRVRANITEIRDVLDR
ncbi:DUF2333 family protein [Rhizobium sp. L1K21]|uniref:DUF2333 family protein n=1 Tax=Rhizobium sp. L1K21 TaxID=2954933 RepID=UPI0020935488|nr:DUF2333 family protein [Rhizobium sp. L1K21]MCO6185385.1 DUF2333 family protein [Rhizobium sp. L1K21]